ncbi:hypothetical protein, partial [Vibrio sp. S9_S30]|uniref:hypothetical protein n=1 Tax=Vibrio sp. S9_S30 TaxID=2720226 RepID=UPI001EED85C2
YSCRHFVKWLGVLGVCICWEIEDALKSVHNKQFKQTKNVWHFQFAVSYVFKVICRNGICTFLAT